MSQKSLDQLIREFDQFKAQVIAGAITVYVINETFSAFTDKFGAVVGEVQEITAGPINAGRKVTVPITWVQSFPTSGKIPIVLATLQDVTTAVAVHRVYNRSYTGCSIDITNLSAKKVTSVTVAIVAIVPN